MNKIAKQIKIIAKQLKFIKIASNIENIVVADDQAVQNAIAPITDSAEQLIQQMDNGQKVDTTQVKQTVQQAKQVQMHISEVRKVMQKIAANWDQALKNIQTLFSGKPQDAFKDVINALSSCKETKQIGKKMWDCFNKVSEQLKDYHEEIGKMDFKTFKETVEDAESGYMKMAVEPFVNLYNEYADDFIKAQKQLQQKVKGVLQSWKQYNEQEGITNNQTNNDQNAPSKPKKMDKQFKFVKSSKQDKIIARMLVKISKQIYKLQK